MDEIKKVVKNRKPRVLSPEARARQIDKKIAKLQDQIAALELEKEELLKPIQLKKAVEEAVGNMSTEELAEKLGIQVDGLVRTVAQWNEYAANGEDPFFGKSGATVAPLQNPPYYGMQVWALAIVAHFGGLKVDETCNVLRVDGNPVPRLYANGLDAGGWMGRMYPGSGTAVGGSYSMARIAARQIAQLADWE